MKRFTGYSTANPLIFGPSSSSSAGSNGRTMGIAVTTDIHQSMKPYPHTYRIYCMHFLFGLLYNIYNVGAIFYIAVITNNSLFVISLTGFITSTVILLFSPLAVRMGDKMNRLRFVQLSLLTKTIVITIGYAMCIALVSTRKGTGDMSELANSDNTYSKSVDVTNARDVNYSVYIYILPFFISIAQLIYNTITISIEKDWMVKLAGRDRQWLMNISKWMSIIDITSQTISPFLVSLLFAFSSLKVITYLLIFTNVSVNLLLFIFLRSIYISWPVLTLRKDLTVYDMITGDEQEYDMKNSREGDSSVASTDAAGSNKGINISAKSDDVGSAGESRVGSKIADYMSQMVKVYESFRYSGCVLIMMSSSLQSLCVLNYGSVMTVYLLSVGMSITTIGSFRGIAAFFGFVGAICYPFLRVPLGLRATGLLSVAFYLLFLSLSASSFYFRGSSNEVKILLLTTFSMVSRVGYSSFDLSTKQISQEAITEINTRNQIYSVWNSITAFFELSTYALTMIFSKSTEFWLLCVISAVASALSAVLFVLDDSSYTNNIFATRKNNNTIDDDKNRKDDFSSSSNPEGTGTTGDVEMVAFEGRDSDLVEVLF